MRASNHRAGDRGKVASAEFQGINSNRDLRDVAFNFRSLFKIESMPASEILTEIAGMMPKYRGLLLAGAGQINRQGTTLSEAVENLFPPATMPAIRAGEDSGSLYDVFDQIWRTAKTQESINKILRGIISPLLLTGLGIVISVCFYLFLIPDLYRNLARNVPRDYDPGFMITSALQANEAIISDWQMYAVGLVLTLIGLVSYITRPSVKAYLGSWLISVVTKIKPIGEAYAHLKFGVMAQYLQIVSMAGLDADKRIDLVMQTLPEPLRPALKAFRAEMLTKSIKEACRSEGRPASDPRSSTVLWPPYIRLAFQQAHEGNWEESMQEFGGVMLQDGEERVTKLLGVALAASLVFVGVIITIPVSMLFGTMGQILLMQARNL